MTEPDNRWMSDRIDIDEQTGVDVRVDGKDVVLGVAGASIRWAIDVMLTANQARQLAKALLDGAGRIEERCQSRQCPRLALFPTRTH